MNYKITIQVLVCLFVLISCSKDQNTPGTAAGNIAFRIAIQQGHAQIEDTPNALRASSGAPTGKGHVAMMPPSHGNDFTSQFSNGDEIGVFAVLSGQELAPENLLIANAKLRFNGTEWIGSLNWPFGKSFDFYAYYPYREDATDPRAISFSVAAEQHSWTRFQQSDVMSARAEGVQHGNAVDLQFEHQMALVQVEVAPRSGIPYRNLSVQLTNVLHSGSFNLGRGELNTSDSKTMIDMYRVEQAEHHDYGRKATYRALVPAQNIPSGHSVLLIKHANQTHLQKQQTAVDLRTGTAHRIAVAELLSNRWDNSVLIQPGIFLMGSPASDPEARDNEKPQHWVRLTKGFYMSRYQITISEYAEFLNAVKAVPGQNGWVSILLDGKTRSALIVNTEYTPTYANGTWGFDPRYAHFPVRYVSFHGALAYARWAGGTLPTEAEWEYACRAGTTTRWYFGDDLSKIYDYEAIYPLSVVGNVGRFLPNPWGLYDMLSNTAEYCFPSFGKEPPTTASSYEKPIIDPIYEHYRIPLALRGAGPNNPWYDTRIAHRTVGHDDSPHYFASFRIIKYQ